MNIDEFSWQVTVWRSQLAGFLERTNKSTLEKETLGEALDELHILLEELILAEEELNGHNPVVASTQLLIEAEHYLYQELFESIPDGYLLTNQHGVIQKANRAAANLLNVSQKLLVGKLLVSFIPSELRKNFRFRLRQLHILNKFSEWEISLQPRNRKPIDVSITTTKVRDQSGNLIGLRWLLREINELKCKSGTPEQTKLFLGEQNARVKDEFLAIVSHELRSPLSVILGWVQTLQNGSVDAVTTARALETIECSTRTQIQLVEDLLDLFQITTGKLQINLVSVPLVPLITTVIDTVRSDALAKSIDLQFTAQFENPEIQVLGDPKRLEQVMRNLLSNAIKFTPKGGKVEVQLEQVAKKMTYPFLPPSPNYAKITVKDTGIGISPEFLPFVFEHFRQGDSTMTRSYGGLGVGLSLVRHLVEMHGGTVDVSSLGQGLGTTFTIKLPV
ncbi:PAS domain-containing sensor histidine kinase [Aetokthonos hydrillicola Thurmond2011]|jgi:PAS domain S-box-containing protein|uniref:Circadian input-output histidine kinase CikA n=1 Tax=Aetokthonos hydrillicola Thurmond2011 TaxID=2712845 RepID=A0AAP5IHI9_9CYAN|nr:PAS domain-containing sensor histidine kinase [Aetokthonos hydrillicola]MBO3458069.1 PAS domain-containing protein [Aetokthonos hydrillicola CCALA 1050]MBW4587095.1 PAS domain-containing sensor histidine kinase [Aetokthonos hydrillicola CCALA 1050]MDR9899655.1 PAS domain-containing sensor histidine kinase [Aetokthonos hydrillicola Thurmond2011]